jgi:hypothetical protein
MRTLSALLCLIERRRANHGVYPRHCSALVLESQRLELNEPLLYWDSYYFDKKENSTPGNTETQDLASAILDSMTAARLLTLSRSF